MLSTFDKALFIVLGTALVVWSFMAPGAQPLASFAGGYMAGTGVFTLFK